MRKFIISLICCLLPVAALADATQIRDNAPDRHVVVKGDTLWGIAAGFFKNPWKWQEIWGLNKDTIKDPHWIYPGDVIVLDRATGTLRVDDSAAAPASDVGGSGVVVKLSPSVRSQDSDHSAIPVIPADDIAPFLSRPLVVEAQTLPGSVPLIGTYEQHVILGTGDIAYVRGLPQDKGLQWQVYRPGKTFTDPETGAVLGHEATYLGEARVEQFGDVSTLRITRSVEEILKGDRLTPAVDELVYDFVPHAPAAPLSARVISIYGGVSQAGQNAIVTINKGRRDGIENGHVLALYRKGEEVRENGKAFSLPDLRYGLLLIFRTFDKVSYGLVMQTRLPVDLLDRAESPE